MFDCVILAASDINASIVIVLVVASIIAILVAILYYQDDQQQQQSTWKRTEPMDEGAEIKPTVHDYASTVKKDKPFDGEDVGAPLFQGDTKKLLVNIDVHDRAWSITPYGPVLFEVVGMMTHDGVQYATLTSGDVSAIVRWDDKYFSKSVYERLGRIDGAWRISKIEPVKHQKKSTPEAKAANYRWLRDDADLGDMFDATLWYHFLFEGFPEPFEHYNTMEVDPTWAPALVLEELLDPVEEPTSEEPLEEWPEDAENPFGVDQEDSESDETPPEAPAAPEILEFDEQEPEKPSAFPPIIDRDFTPEPEPESNNDSWGSDDDGGDDGGDD